MTLTSAGWGDFLPIISIKKEQLYFEFIFAKRGGSYAVVIRAGLLVPLGDITALGGFRGLINSWNSRAEIFLFKLDNSFSQTLIKL